MALGKLPFRKKLLPRKPRSRGLYLDLSSIRKNKNTHSKAKKNSNAWHFQGEINFQGQSNSMYLNEELSSSAYL
jgi:hypothetical protein